MKWCSFIILFAYCAAEQVTIHTANLPTSQVGTQPRIIGGTNTSIESYPYIVQVLYFRTAVCGGTLITERHVLSAAHCFFDEDGVSVNPRAYTIRAGSTRLGSGGTIHAVSMIITHESYNRPVANDNDVAVLVLATAVHLGATVATATLPSQGEEVPDNSTVIHLGWGTTNALVHAPSVVLQEVEIRVIGHVPCQAQYQLYGDLLGYPGRFPITTNMICSGLLGVGGKDACQGDSGGPLEYGGRTLGDVDPIVVGVTSWGAGCADARFPGVNAKVSAYTDWINNTVIRYNASPPVGQISGILMLVSIVTSIILGSK